MNCADHVRQKKIAICTTGVYDPALPKEADYVFWTNKIKQHYCNHYGLSFIHSDQNPHPGRDAHFARFSNLLYALVEAKCDWAIWMDCDAAPVGLNVSIREFLDAMPQDKVIIQKDTLGWNSGVMAFPNTPAVIEWLKYLDSEETYEKFKNVPFQDQAAIGDSIDNSKEFYDAMIAEPDMAFGFNAYDDIYPYLHGRRLINPYIPGKSWCLHIAGYGDNYRRIRFEGIYKNLHAVHCPVCGCIAGPYFTVPFDKTYDYLTEDVKSKLTRHDEWTCDYYVCPNCEYIFSPFFADWKAEEYLTYIYNDEYEKYIDPAHCDGSRDKRHFDEYWRPIVCNQARHLDYGGGRGGFVKLLRDKIQLWSDSYDPFYDGNEGNDGKKRSYILTKDCVVPSKYSLVTCFEVLEHIYDPHDTFRFFRNCTTEHASIVLSTQLWDGNPPHLFGLTPAEWPNIAPRNGHVSMHSHRSLEYLCAKYGFRMRRDLSNCFAQTLERIPYSARREKVEMQLPTKY